MKLKRITLKFTLCIFLQLLSIVLLAQSINPGWPKTSAQTKPWTRWWWHGSAVTKEGITQELEALKNAGIGGVEITPIYGVHGYENQFVKFLSPQWMDLFDHVLKEASRLDLGVDMATGTGWPFGGPWVSEEYAAKNFQHKVYEISSGQSLKEKIEFIQQPSLRAIGSSIYESNKEGEAILKAPFAEFQSKKIDIRDIQTPVEKNDNLQSYAIDQVQFERKLPLIALMGYSEDGKSLDLMRYVDKEGMLQWNGKGNWKLYAVFQGWHGKMVERAAPGGEGNVVDHFSPAAIDNYFSYFDRAFQGHDLKNLRAFFNDSYEVDDAKGSADWTPHLFEEFIKRRGYDLKLHLPALFGDDTSERNERILSDYRQTVSDMLQDHFTKKWKSWATKHNALIRNQAHGSPANILDLYGIVDIPEIEGEEPLRIKMASSAGNVMGKTLVSSESATWLNDHFESNLHDVKKALDRFMLNGVNHIFYHGTAYSPKADPWPGWLFYAAVHFNSRNPLWNDFDALNQYVERCQSFLQNTRSDNDVLLYYPVHDKFAERGSKMLEHFDGVRQFEGSSFVKTAEMLLKENYAFDYISDAQIQNLVVEAKVLVTQGKSQYRVLVVPSIKYMPLTTMNKILNLVSAGGKVVFVDELPQTYSGFADNQTSAQKFKELVESLQQQQTRFENLSEMFQQHSVRREALPQSLAFIRKKQSDGSRIYFINNNSDQYFEGWITLQSSGEGVVIYEPMNNVFGKAALKSGNQVYVQLESHQSIVLQFFDRNVKVPAYRYNEIGKAIPLTGEWELQFHDGGPQVPTPLRAKELASWTAMGETYADFSGSCTYRLTFAKPLQQTNAFLLDLGVVKESASLTLNGKFLGKLIGPTYKISIDASRLKDSNVLEVRVSNLMANRIAYMDRRGIFWKKFYNVNIAAHTATNRLNGIFDASQWAPRASGLVGPVTIAPIDLKKVF